MDPYIGEIRLFASTYAPKGWLLCDGQSVQINDNQLLFALLGTRYGGDGTTTFQVPDLRGLLVCGTGQGTGLANNYALGQTFGQPTVTLTQAQTPHTHAVMASTLAATSRVPTNGVFAVPATPAVLYAQNSAGGLTQRTLDSALLSTAGGNSPHANLMASIAVNYIICSQGLFPSSN
jgi:microcystin-dependent protein